MGVQQGPDSGQALDARLEKGVGKASNGGLRRGPDDGWVFDGGASRVSGRPLASHDEAAERFGQDKVAECRINMAHITLYKLNVTYMTKSRSTRPTYHTGRGRVVSNRVCPNQFVGEKDEENRQRVHNITVAATIQEGVRDNPPLKYNSPI